MAGEIRIGTHVALPDGRTGTVTWLERAEPLARYGPSKRRYAIVHFDGSNDRRVQYASDLTPTGASATE